MGTGWTSLPLPFPCTCHALAARKYWRVRIDPNPNIGSAASVWLDQTPSITMAIILVQHFVCVFYLLCECIAFLYIFNLFFLLDFFINFFLFSTVLHWLWTSSLVTLLPLLIVLHMWPTHYYWLTQGVWGDDSCQSRTKWLIKSLFLNYILFHYFYSMW